MIGVCAASWKLVIKIAIHLLWFSTQCLGASPAHSLDSFSSSQSQSNRGFTSHPPGSGSASGNTVVYDATLPRSFSQTTDPEGFGKFQDQARYIRSHPDKLSPRVALGSRPHESVRAMGAMISSKSQKLADSRLDDKAHNDDDEIYERLMSKGAKSGESGRAQSLISQESLPDVASEILANPSKSSSKKRKPADMGPLGTEHGAAAQRKFMVDVISQLPDKEREKYLKDFKAYRRSEEKAQKEQRVQAQKAASLEDQLHHVNNKIEQARARELEGIGQKLGNLKKEIDYQEAMMQALVEKGKRQVTQRKLAKAWSRSASEASRQRISMPKHSERDGPLRKEPPHIAGEPLDQHSERLERPPTFTDERMAYWKRQRKTHKASFPAAGKASERSDPTRRPETRKLDRGEDFQQPKMHSRPRPREPNRKLMPPEQEQASLRQAVQRRPEDFPPHLRDKYMQKSEGSSNPAGNNRYDHYH